MKKCSLSAVFLVLLFVLSFMVFADNEATLKKELTFDGKSLSEYASMDNIPSIEGYSAYAININTGTVVYDKKPDDKVYPASTTKLMTAIVAYENIPDLDVEIAASEYVVRNTQGANVRIEAGEIYTARELLNALLIEGANDAALMLAEYVSGSEEEFCTLMNSKAQQIGAYNTHYDNVTGFHSDTTVTTARDTGLIAQYFYYIPELFDISDTTRFESDSLKRVLTNRNYLLSIARSDKYFYNKAAGMSMGSTPEGGYCIVSTVMGDDNQVYLAVVMNSKEINGENFACKDIISIFEFCMNNFSYQTVASTNTAANSINVNNAVDTDSIVLFPESEIKALLPDTLDYTNDIKFEIRVDSKSADAPVNKGQRFGELVVRYKDDVIVGHTSLVSDVSVDKSNVLYFFSRVKSILTGKWFTVFIVTALILFLIYFGFSVYYKYFKKNKYTKNRPRR